MKRILIAAFSAVARLLAVAAMFLMLYAALWIGYYAGIPM